MLLTGAALGLSHFGSAFAANEPAALFAGGRDGAWLEISLENCFQDVSAATPAGVGDPVGRVSDLSGNGYHALQSTAGFRPTLRQAAGGQYYLEFNGLDTHLEFLIPFALFTSGLHYCLAYDNQSDAAGTLYSSYTASQSWGMLFNDGSASSSVVNISNATEPSQTLRINDSSATATTRDNIHTAIDGKFVQSWEFSGATGAYLGSTTLGIGAYSSSSFSLSGHLYGLIWGATFTAAELLRVESYLARRGGITL